MTTNKVEDREEDGDGVAVWVGFPSGLPSTEFNRSLALKIFEEKRCLPTQNRRFDKVTQASRFWEFAQLIMLILK